MAVYPIENNAFVSVKDLDKVLTVCEPLVENQVVSIRFERAVERIDIVFVGGLFLLYKQKKLKFDLSGVCGPSRKSVFGFWEDGVYAFIQYIDQIHDLYSPEDDWLVFSGRNEVPARKEDSATVYAPVLYIDETNLPLFFETNRDDLGSYKKKYIERIRTNRKNDQEIDYYAHKGNVAESLENKSPMEVFVFSLLYFVDNPFVLSKKIWGANPSKKVRQRVVKERVEKMIPEMLDFSEQFVDGLKELAKNIVEHSQFGKGIITLRAYLNEEETMRNLEAYVIDYGTVGIIPQMTMDLQNQANKTHEDQEDLELLSSKEFHLTDLMERSNKLLFRQIRREMAHLGLIHFVSLIKSREGSYSVSTASFDKKREGLGEALRERNLSYGTNFHFTLPLKKSQGTLSKDDPTGESALSQEKIMAMSDLLKQKDCIQMVHLPKMTVLNRDDEIELVQSADEPQEGKTFYAVDFSGFEGVSATSLLRILALFSRKTNRNLIAYNIVTNTFCEMLNVNEEYFQRLKDVKNVGYWLKGKSVLVYSHLAQPKKKEGEAEETELNEGMNHFFFADMLFGQKKEEFIGVNKAISHVFPNFVSLSSPSDLPAEISMNRKGTIPVHPFFSGIVLMPFDIILEGFDGEKETGYSLFFSNLDYLLNKEIDGDI